MNGSPTRTQAPKVLTPSGLFDSPAFSHVAVIPPGSTTILVGGQNGVDESGEVVGEDMKSQAARALANLETALGAAGATLHDVVLVRIFLVADADLEAGYAEFQKRWGDAGDPPLVTAAIVAGLAVPGALLELEAVAALGG